MKPRISARGGFLLVDALVSMAILAGVMVVAIASQRAFVSAYRKTSGDSAAIAVAQTTISPFLSTKTSEEPTTSFKQIGVSSMGEAITLSSKVIQHQTEGMTKFEVVGSYGDKPTQRVLCGALRLDPITQIEDIPLPDSNPASGASLHSLQVLASNTHGSVSVGGVYTFGSVIELTASPSSGHNFVRWEGVGEIENRYSETTTILLDEDRSITAIFQ